MQHKHNIIGDCQSWAILLAAQALPILLFTCTYSMTINLTLGRFIWLVINIVCFFFNVLIVTCCHLTIQAMKINLYKVLVGF